MVPIPNFTLFLLIIASLCFSCTAFLISSPSTSSSASAFPLSAHPGTVIGFYNKTCPNAEAIIRSVVKKRFAIDKTITPALLRMIFHDSFVRGTDASILLDSKPGHVAEKEALPNLTIRGYDLIDEAKAAVEAACPGVVSCADVLVLATRDSVTLAGGPDFEIPTGRRDGKISIKEEALNLPSPAFPVEQSRESFVEKGLDSEDMVALLGAHTVGVALCGFFNDRLFNFHGTGAADPNMNPSLVNKLSTVCPNPFFTESNADPPINLDQGTPNTFDSAYYVQIQSGNGILQIDQEITVDPTTADLVRRFTSPEAFYPAFIKSFIKMTNIGVITSPNDTRGEIRRNCHVSNPRSFKSPVKPVAPSSGAVHSRTPATTPMTSRTPPGVRLSPSPGHQSSPSVRLPPSTVHQSPSTPHHPPSNTSHTPSHP